MPIVDILVVCKTPEQVGMVSAQALADSLGQVFHSEPGRTWVRTHTMAAAAYAENGVRLDDSDLPAFVTVTHSHIPEGGALAIEVQVVTEAVAKCIGRTNERVHVQYAPPGAGRQAFGGKLVE
jgi:hypothetical protein